METDDGICLPAERFQGFATDGVIYHHSIASAWPWRLLKDPPKRLATLYHNITPAKYFSDSCLEEPDRLKRLHNRNIRMLLDEGVRQLDLLSLITQETWADSSFNATELRDLYFPNITTIPLLRDYEIPVTTPPDQDLIKGLGDGRPNLLFVGRLSPNKCQHDLLNLAATLKSQGIPIRLLLAGKGGNSYESRLREFSRQLGLTTGDLEVLDKDVVFLGQVEDQELTALYQSSLAFVSMSEHEGFCVPIVEAMFFGVPIIAHPAGAVPETLGRGGILVPKQEEDKWIQEIVALMSDRTHQRKCSNKSQEETGRYTNASLESQFYRLVQSSFPGL